MIKTYFLLISLFISLILNACSNFYYLHYEPVSSKKANLAYIKASILYQQADYQNAHKELAPAIKENPDNHDIKILNQKIKTKLNQTL